MEEFGGGGVAEGGAVEVVGCGAFGEESAIDFGFGALEAALLPVAADEGVDVELFEGGLGMELAVVVDSELLVGGSVFAGDDDGLGVEAMFERVEAGSVLALGGAGTGGFLRVGAVGSELRWGRHGRVLSGVGSREVKKSGIQEFKNSRIQE
jgi:hypothetical protein